LAQQAIWVGHDWYSYFEPLTYVDATLGLNLISGMVKIIPTVE